MENKSQKVEQQNQRSGSSKQKNSIHHQEQQAGASKPNANQQEHDGNRYNKHGYLDDKERYDDAEL